MAEHVKYKIVVKTESQYADASTNASVSVQMVGEDGIQTDWVYLNNFWRNDFERGQIDEFEVECADVGRPLLLRLKLEHGYYRKDIWAGEEIIVERGSYVDYFPLHEWVENYVEIARSEATLPQKISNKAVQYQRKEEVEKNKSVYSWTTAKEDVLPRHQAATTYEELPKVFQQEDVRRNYFNSNRKISKRNVILEVVQSFFHKMSKLDDYKCLCSQEDIPEDLPLYMSKWDTDKEFGRQMLNGINPYIVKKCNSLPEGCLITHKMVEAFLEGYSLNTAIKCGRIYIMDYFETLKGVKRNVGAKGRKLYCPDALCLFMSRKNGDFVPIAIQLEAGNVETIFTPLDKQEDWLLAKMYFRCIDANYQEWVTHFLRTHSAMEPVAVALFQCFGRAHPVYKLLRPHLSTVPAINTLARTVLISPNAASNLAISIKGTDSAKKAYQTFSFNDLDIPNLLERNGTMDKTLLPNYFYRDDICELWKIIEDYVASVLLQFYKCAADVQEDYELQDWIKNIAFEGFGWDGNLRDTPTSFKTAEDLKNFCTIVIATCSVQHAAINFGQFDIYKFVPNAPAAMRKDLHRKGEGCMERIIETLPDTKMSVIKLGICFALSRYSPNEIYLGQFPRKLFYESEVTKAMEKFKEDLTKVGKKIDRRNEMLEFPYEYLHPSKVPASIAV